MGYLEFGLKIRPKDDGYVAELTDEERGDASEEFALATDSLRIQNLLLRMGRTRVGTRTSPDSDQFRAATDMGRLLFDTVFVGSIREKLTLARDDAKELRTGVRVRLHLDEEDATLLDLPWEYLYDSESGQFLSLSQWTPVVRYIRSKEYRSTLTFKPPLRILAAISGAVPKGSSELDVEHEWHLLESQALVEGIRKGLISLDRVPATMPTIDAALRSADYHVFHYIGHSGFANGASSLWLEDHDGDPVAWSGNKLGQRLGPHRTLQLAVFNSCEGARQSATDHFAGIAPSLIKKGIPAVVAMQFEITDAAAILFARSFYEVLADGEPVDRAVWVARNAIFGSNNDVEWGTPVLFLRSRDGTIFDRKELTAAETAALARHARWYREAKDHIADRRWAEAAAVLDRIHGERPDYLDTEAMLDHVRERLDEGVSGGEPATDVTAEVASPDAPRGAGEPGDAANVQEQAEPAPGPPWAGWLLAAVITVVIVIVLISLFSGGS